jgi:hypothetical protein
LIGCGKDFTDEVDDSIGTSTEFADDFERGGGFVVGVIRGLSGERNGKVDGGKRLAEERDAFSDDVALRKEAVEGGGGRLGPVVAHRVG